MKFASLLKKEIKELLTIQAILGIIISLVAFYAFGNIMGGIMNDLEKESQEIIICDQDKSEFTTAIISSLEQQEGVKLKKVELESDDYTKELKRLDINGLIIIPEGFTEKALTNSEKAVLENVSIMNSMSMTGSMSGAMNSAGLQIIQQAVRTTIMTSKNLTPDEIAHIENPVELKEITIVGDKSAEISRDMIGGFVSMQSTFVPIVIFMLVLYASQLIISAISTEKLDKTLETLLSAPVSRMAVLSSKMIAAALVAAFNAGAYMIGFSQLMNSMTGSVMNGDESTEMSNLISELGLKLQGTDYLMLGLQMFLTILIALSVSLILGALAKDVKSAQTLSMPIMFCAMIPYMLTLFVDVASLSIVPKLLVYAIPFTHTFTAVENILFAHTTVFWGGVIYQILFLCICMFFAVRVFMTDKLFTISLSFGQKTKMKSKGKSLKLFKK